MGRGRRVAPQAAPVAGRGLPQFQRATLRARVQFVGVDGIHRPAVRTKGSGRGLVGRLGRCFIRRPAHIRRPQCCRYDRWKIRVAFQSIQGRVPGGRGVGRVRCWVARPCAAESPVGRSCAPSGDSSGWALGHPVGCRWSTPVGGRKQPDAVGVAIRQQFGQASHIVTCLRFAFSDGSKALP